jgi:hypothetical protein
MKYYGRKMKEFHDEELLIYSPLKIYDIFMIT